MGIRTLLSGRSLERLEKFYQSILQKVGSFMVANETFTLPSHSIDPTLHWLVLKFNLSCLIFGPLGSRERHVLNNGISGQYVALGGFPPGTPVSTPTIRK